MSPIRHADHNRVPFQAAGEISGFEICGGVRLSNAGEVRDAAVPDLQCAPR
jgi:hypothetical protein